MAGKFISSALVLTLSTTLAASELAELGDVYVLDGSINAAEVRDDERLTTVYSTESVIVKSSDVVTYVGIRSNTSTILNAYIVKGNGLQVLHASAALGEVSYQRDGDVFRTQAEKFEWIYRDPGAWGDDLHPDGETSLSSFYDRFGWSASTWYMGSYREFEMIISNRLLENADRLVFSFTSAEDGERGLRFVEDGEATTLTSDPEVDQKLHNGDVPSVLRVIL